MKASELIESLRKGAWHCALPAVPEAATMLERFIALADELDGKDMHWASPDDIATRLREIAEGRE